MRLLFCVNRDIYANLALNRILPNLQPDDECLVFFSEKVGGPKTPKAAALDFLKFYEQDLPNQYLFPLYESWRTKADGSEAGELKTFRQLSDLHRVPMQGVRNINSPETLEQIAALQPDLIVSIRFGHIFRDAVLKLPKYGVINLHSGLLPEYRGVLATFWSLLHEAPQYGYTLHHISDPSIDTGDIIERQARPTQPECSLFWHIVNLYAPAADSILKAIQAYRSGVAPPVLPQAHQHGAYYSIPTAQDFDAFQRNGLKLLEEADYFQLLQRFHPAQPDLATLPDFRHAANLAQPEPL